MHSRQTILRHGGCKQGPWAGADTCQKPACWSFQPRGAEPFRPLRLNSLGPACAQQEEKGRTVPEGSQSRSGEIWSPCSVSISVLWPQRAGGLRDDGNTLELVGWVQFPIPTPRLTLRHAPPEFLVKRECTQEGSAEPENRMLAKGGVPALEGPAEVSGPAALTHWLRVPSISPS